MTRSRTSSPMCATAGATRATPCPRKRSRKCARHDAARRGRRGLTRTHACALRSLAAGPCSPAPSHAAPEPVVPPGGSFASVLPQADGTTIVTVDALRARPPSRHQRRVPRVRDRTSASGSRDGVARALRRRALPDSLGRRDGARRHARAPRQPVTRVSWFAAKAYCEARGARLPTLVRVGVRGRRRRDAPPTPAQDPAWRQRILDWYAQPSSLPLPDVGSARAERLRRQRSARPRLGMGARLQRAARERRRPRAGRRGQVRSTAAPARSASRIASSTPCSCASPS